MRRDEPRGRRSRRRAGPRRRACGGGSERDPARAHGLVLLLDAEDDAVENVLGEAHEAHAWRLGVLARHGGEPKLGKLMRTRPACCGCGRGLCGGWSALRGCEELLDCSRVPLTDGERARGPRARACASSRAESSELSLTFLALAAALSARKKCAQHFVYATSESPSRPRAPQGSSSPRPCAASRPTRPARRRRPSP